MTDPTHGDQSTSQPSPTPGLISSGSAPESARVDRAWDQREPSSQSQDGNPAAADRAEEPTATVVLTADEARVLGVLIEKSFLTPDIYPMTTNAIVTACNQKTNREPVVSYDATLVDGTLLELRQRSLVRRVHTAGSRSTKHRHTLDEALRLDRAELALMSVLLLRGDQTMGELRLRTDRHDVGFDDLDAVEQYLERLAQRATPLVRMLDRRPGHKENRWRHLLADPDEATDRESELPGRRPQPTDPSTADAPEAREREVRSTGSEDLQSSTVASDPNHATSPLSDRVAELEREVANLRDQLGRLAAALGEPID